MRIQTVSVVFVVVVFVAFVVIVVAFVVIVVVLVSSLSSSMRSFSSPSNLEALKSKGCHVCLTDRHKDTHVNIVLEFRAKNSQLKGKLDMHDRI